MRPRNRSSSVLVPRRVQVRLLGSLGTKDVALICFKLSVSLCVLLHVWAISSAAKAPKRAVQASVKERIIAKMVEADRRFQSLQSWNLVYKHRREYKNFPSWQEGSFDYPEYNIRNARFGSNLLLDLRGIASQSRRFFLWREGVSLEQDDVLRRRTITPDFHPYFTTFFKFTDYMFLDVYRGIRFRSPVEIEIFNTPSPSASKYFMLPRAILVEPSNSYRLRKATEVVDGHECWVLERPDNDIIWVDAGSNYAVRKRMIFDKSVPLFLFENKEFFQALTGFYFPKHQILVQYNGDEDKKVARTVHHIEYNDLISLEFDKLSLDDFIPPPMETGGRVDDQVAGYSYAAYSPGTNPFTGTIEKIRSNYRLDLPSVFSLKLFANAINFLLLFVLFTSIAHVLNVLIKK